MPIQIRYGGGFALDGIHSRLYPNNEFYIKTLKDIPEDIIVRYGTMHDFFAAMFLADAIAERNKGLSGPRLIIPFVPGSRQDRLMDGDYLFSAKTIAKEINMRNFKEVRIFDPHSNVIAALIDRCRVNYIDDYVHSLPFTIDWDAIVAPDTGAHTRALRLATRLKLPLIQAWKSRDTTTGSLSGFGCEDIPHVYDHVKKVLVVDDICDGGGTFAGLGNILVKKYGLKADLYVSHGFFTKGIEELKELYSRIYTTDSVFYNHSGCHELPVLLKMLSF